MNPNELSREHLLGIVRDQQDHIERLRSMLWTAAGIDDDEPELTEADFTAALATPSELQIVNMIAELGITSGKDAGGPQCSK